ncbi:MAG TPA: hypothetical protein PK020_07680 [Ilumatobacteraceae bacterium]|nr:hypothetical protein [Ilumatobacteraceae bacterium]HRB02823.1 hypothetical protein [Ilumatobacteraceae bacterium]
MAQQRLCRALDDLRDNFADLAAEGVVAYADQVRINHPDMVRRVPLADAVTAVNEYHGILTA